MSKKELFQVFGLLVFSFISIIADGYSLFPEMERVAQKGETLQVCELFIPNAFSPDGDGINDYLKIRCIDNYPDAYLEVYNRWGNLIYKKANYGNIEKWGESNAWWDGTCNTEWIIGDGKLPSGTYMFILKLNDGKSEPKKGTIFLNR
jgi:gliding motility-associated-like protein